MVRYFTTVRPVSGTGVAVLAAVTIFGLATLWLDPRELDSSLGLVLFVQMFLASSGFVMPARRGHFDPVLIHGSRRVAAILGHWALSVAPGAAAWLLLTGAGLAWHSPTARSALAGARLVSLVIVSAVAWSVGFAGPRGVGGGLWIGTLVALLLRHVDPLSGASTQTVLGTIRAAVALVICPFLTLGVRNEPSTAAILTAAILAASVMAATCAAGRTLDVFLSDRS